MSDDIHRSIVEASAELLCRWEPDTTLVFVNRRFCEFFGKEAADLLGRRWAELAPPGKRERIERHCAELRREPRTALFEVEMKDATGRIRRIEWLDQPLEGDAFQSAGRDVTDRAP